MRASSSGYGVASERQFSQESIERLANDALFDFQIQNGTISVRVATLQELLQRGREEPDLADLLDEFVHELEDLIHDAGSGELFLLAALQHFRQQMELFLELDQDARMAQSGVTTNIFAPSSSSTIGGNTKKTAATIASPRHKKTAILQANMPATHSPGRSKHQRQHHAKPAIRRTNTTSAEEEIVCGVCLQADSLEHDPIVICDMCSVAVHQSCYRIEELPDEDWFCRPCQRYLEAQDVGSNVTPTYALECVACTAKGGAFIATVDEDQWVHMACSMFLPELFVQTSHRQNGDEVIGGIEQLGERRKLRCTYCKKKNRGACAQCVVGKCTVSYHVMCALQHNVKFAFMEDTGQFGSGCARHQKQFCGVENSATTATADNATGSSRPRPGAPHAPPKQQQAQSKYSVSVGAPSPSASPSRLHHKKTGTKGKKRLPRRRGSVTSESGSNGDDDDDDEDGIVLDEESDNSSMFSSDVDSDADLQSPIRTTAAASPSSRYPPKATTATVAAAAVLGASPVKPKSPSGRGGVRGRPPKKQQTLMVPSFGIVKHLTKPTVAIPPPLAPAPAPSSAVRGPVTLPHTQVAPSPSPSPSAAAARLHTTKTQIFIPFSGAVADSGGVFEDVLVIIPTMPLGISIRTENRAHGTKVMLIQGLTSQTHNLVVVDALRRGILHDGDEMVAMNDVSLRNREANTLKDTVAALQPPYRIWLKLKSKRSLAQFGILPQSTGGTTMQTTSTPSKPATPLAKPLKGTPVPQPQPEPKEPSEDANLSTQPPLDHRTPKDEALSVDWPWFYLRSDGKLAMNLMWKSLDAGFFVTKINPKTWQELLNKVEAHVGFCLRKTHADYAHKTQDLLYFPSRELPVPRAIQEFRAQQQKKKQRHLATDSVFMGVCVEQVSQEEEWDTLPPLAVGTTVQVAKRTWPGINKLGGAGRVRKVHEVKSENGDKMRHLYDIGYVLGGSERKVERKWIAVVSDLGNEPKQTPTKQQHQSQSQQDASQKPTDDKEEVEAEENESVRLRLGLRLEVSDRDAELPVAMVSKSTQRKVHLQVSVLTNSISLQKEFPEKSDGDAMEATAVTKVAPKREMLWHQHFPVKQSGDDALLSDALSGALAFFEERSGGDKGDVNDGERDDADSDDEPSEIATQLREAQTQFKHVMQRNDVLFDALSRAVETEYTSKQYRKRKLSEIQASHFEKMYRDMALARKAFDASDDSSDDDPDDGEQDGDRHTDATARRAAPGDQRTTKDRHNSAGESDSGSGSDSDQDDSCGGMFINKIKQEGHEVCVLCELTGGDFAATACGRVVHPQCAMYTPETFFKNGLAHGLDKIPSVERRALTCSICGGKNGLSKIQCGNQRCLTAYHVSCAYVNGLLTRDPHYQAWCPKHLKSSGMQSEIEWPPHMKPQATTARKSSKTETHNPHQAAKKQKKTKTKSQTTPDRRRKRRRSESVESRHVDTVDGMAVPSSAGRKKQQRFVPGSHVINVDADDDHDVEDEDAMAERTLARRLDVDGDDSEDREDDDEDELSVVFTKGDTVHVQAREWPGVNKPGGVARITRVTESGGSGGALYDVAYVLTSAKEKQVEAKYVRRYGGGAKDSKQPKKRSRGGG